jgi:hypothetical protein
MAEHNGDYSPEAEYKRKMKREKVQRSRIRKRIDEGRATAMEIAAMDAWDNGEDWNLGEREPGGYPAQDRAPRTPRRAVAQDAQEEAPGMGWKSWLGVGGFIAACVIMGLLGVRKANE